MGLIVIFAPIALERSSVEKLNESSLFHSHVWDNELEVEFRRETVSRDRIWIPAGLLTMVFLWVVLLGFSWIGGFTHDSFGLFLRGFTIIFLVACAATIFSGLVQWPLTVVMVSCGVLINSSVFIFLVFREVLNYPGPNAMAAVVSIGPAAVFAIFWMNTMLRLPAKLAAIIALLFVVVVLSFSFYAAPFSVVFRQAMYYFVALVSGHVMSTLTERRERTLFLQRRLLISAKKSAEEALEKVEEARREKERLIAAINHDLRQPMTAAVMHLDVLQRNVERRDFVGVADQSRKARAAIDLLGGSLDHVLNAADDERAPENFHLEHVDVSLVLRTLLDTYSPQAERLGLRCRIRLPAAPLFVLSNRQSLFRVLGNLVTNALKFTPASADGTNGVLIAASVRRGVCRIEVIDTGIGISSEKTDEIWLPYHQLNSSQQDRLNGLGLGLFLVRRIVEKLPGHQISVRSRLGRGTRFTVTIACGTETNESVEAMKPAVDHRLDEAALEPLSGAYVLLLEDDREARVAISELLEEWGVIVASGSNIETLKASHDDAERMVDAIVSDYSLQSGLNGLDAFDTIDTWLGYSPTRVLITGEDLTETPRILASPSVTVLRKPFSPSALASHLLAAVDSSKRLEAS
jgi:signal transduction histidine kinase/CheY-like chemotaxis protein